MARRAAGTDRGGEPVTGAADDRGRGEAPVVVELLGLPGSGKSRLAPLLVEALAGRGAFAARGATGVEPGIPPARRIAYKVSLLGLQGLTRPMASMKAAAKIGMEQRTPGDAAARTVQWLVTQRLLEAARRDHGLRVFDEGALQALWSVGLRAHHGRWLRLLRLLDDGHLAWVEPDVVVLVDVPQEVVRERLEARPSAHSRTQGLPRSGMAVELRRGGILLDELIGWWRARRGDQALLRIDNAGAEPVGLDDAAARIAMRCLPGSPAHHRSG
jgi:hypothetical protein